MAPPRTIPNYAPPARKQRRAARTTLPRPACNRAHRRVFLRVPSGKMTIGTVFIRSARIAPRLHGAERARARRTVDGDHFHFSGVPAVKRNREQHALQDDGRVGQQCQQGHGFPHAEMLGGDDDGGGGQRPAHFEAEPAYPFQPEENEPCPDARQPDGDAARQQENGKKPLIHRYRNDKRPEEKKA